MRRNFLKIISSYFLGFLFYPFSSAIGNNLVGYNTKLNKNEKITFIFSTHDQRVIDRARRVITLEDGKIVSDKKK